MIALETSVKSFLRCQEEKYSPGTPWAQAFPQELLTLEVFFLDQAPLAYIPSRAIREKWQEAAQDLPKALLPGLHEAVAYRTTMPGTYQKIVQISEPLALLKTPTKPWDFLYQEPQLTPLAFCHDAWPENFPQELWQRQCTEVVNLQEVCYFLSTFAWLEKRSEAEVQGITQEAARAALACIMGYPPDTARESLLHLNVLVLQWLKHIGDEEQAARKQEDPWADASHRPRISYRPAGEESLGTSPDCGFLQRSP